MVQPNVPRIHVDFQNADAQGRLRLNSTGTAEDLSRQNVQLKQGLVLHLYSDDADEKGSADDLVVTGRVEFAADEQMWVVVIDWNAIRHASDGEGRKAAS